MCYAGLIDGPFLFASLRVVAIAVRILRAEIHALGYSKSFSIYDESSQQIHILGHVPGSAGDEGDAWTVYVGTPARPQRTRTRPEPDTI